LRVSTRGHYGLKAMYDLALNYADSPVSLKSVAKRQSLSVQYLEQLMALLKKAGLVKSVRGVRGGYILASAPEEIMVGDVIRVLEGPLAPVDCVREIDPGKCDQADDCITKIVWEKIRNSIAEVMDSISLADLCREAEKKKKKNTNK
jgi:Rrf2 family cysteine metabolism transcriptional repressor